MVSGGPPRVLIAGGGYIGVHTALKLEDLRAGEVDVVLVNPENFMLYQPLLPEVASGTLEPRHGVVPLRKALRRTRLITGRLAGLDHDRRVARIEPTEGASQELEYDHVVVGLGSMSRVLPIPGLAERAVGFKSVAEAIWLRNRVLSRLDVAEAETSPDTRRRALTFVFVGGGYAGVEALAELEDMARAACRYLHSVRRLDMRWVLIEAMDRILPVVHPELSAYALTELRRRGVAVYLNTTMESAQDGQIRLSNGEEFAADTIVWSAGIKPHTLVGKLGLPVDDKGRLPVDEYLRVEGAEGAWAGGDCAAVPDLDSGGLCPPTAQYALREGRHLGRNLAAAIRDRPLEPFRYTSRGEMVTLGRHKGVAQLYGRRLRGFPSWALRRGYYAANIPTVNRKIRVLADWSVELFFRRDIVHLGSLHHPRQAFTEALDRDGE